MHSNRGVKTDEARAAELAATLESKLEGYERILSKQRYLAGDVCTRPRLRKYDIHTDCRTYVG